MVINPMIDWLRLLETVQLTGILTEKFSNIKIDKFTRGNPLVSDSLNMQNLKDSQKILEKVVDLPIIRKVDEVRLHNFRPYSSLSYNSMNFKQVNVIYGKNGSGKSSLLEAIEFAITNEIRSLGDYKDKSYKDMQTEVLCTTQLGQTVLSSGKKPTTLKKLEAFWYGTSSGTGKAMLNDQFFRFNFFDTYSAYKFALEESTDSTKRKDSNYIEKFSRLLFSDQLIVMEKNWLRYKEGFEEHLDILSKDYDRSLSSYDMYKQWASNESSSQYKLRLDNFLLILQEMNFKSSCIENTTTNMEEILEVFEILIPYIENTVPKIFLDKNFTKLEIKQTKESLMNTINCISESIEEDKKKQHMLDDAIILAKDKMFNIKNNLQYKIKEISDLDQTVESWQQVSHIFLNMSITSKVKSLITLENQLEEYLHFLKINKQQYNVLYNLNEILILDNDEFNTLKGELQTYLDSYKVLIQKELEMEFLFDKMESIQIQLINMGIEYLDYADPTFKTCPLCGNISKSKDELVELIKNRASNQKEKGATSLLKEKRELENHIETIKLKLAKHEESQKMLEFYSEACKIKGLLKQGQTSDLEKIKYTIGTFEIIVEELQRTKEQLLYLAEKGYTIEKIEEAEYFLNTCLLLKDIKFELPHLTNLFIELKEDNLKEKLRYEAELNKCETLINQYSLQKNRLKENIDEKQGTIEEKNKGLKEIINIIQFYEAASKYFDIPEGMELSKWLNNFNEAYVRCKNLINEGDSPEYYHRRMKETEFEIEKIKVSLNRLKEAVDTINSLRTLSSYAEEIVDNNIDKINRYFKSLHTSGEFEEILVKPEGIFLKRTNFEELAKPYELSTGQRTAIALSIMFALHYSAQNVPKLLMFDEPVANMDENQLRSFLDLLVEFATNGEQIFITTANDQMYQLMKQKFSVLINDVNYLELASNR
ncbi:AAA family ATPase [Priestia koreensis]|uniref:AAA family ATPase n=1 Tax=Priestia koreensis TaxID=284581 RepID=UPI003D0067CD